jgi:alpha-tubulin suppressor-like RCC1 family protein
MKRLLQALVLLFSGALLAQSGPVVEVFAPQINAQVRITGCARDTQNRVVCAVVFESKAQTNQSVTVLQNTVRALAPDGTVYRGRFSAEGGTADDTKAVFSLPTGMRVNASLLFPNVPSGVTLFAQVTFGGLEFRGIPVAQGRETPTQAAPAPKPAPAEDLWTSWDRRLSVGPHHVLYVGKNGTVWAWGLNKDGQLGTGKTSEVELKPVKVQGLTDVVQVAAGARHSLALRRDGTVWAWGNNDRGQVGITPNPLVPHPVRGLTDVVAIRAGWNTSYALRRDGTLWAWGWGRFGVLGVGDFSDRAVPTQVQGLSGIKALPEGLFGDAVAGVLKEDGTVWVWGNNAFGLLGRGTSSSCSHWDPDKNILTWGWDPRRGQPAPIQVEGLKDVSQLAVGGTHFVALLKTGEVVAWGLTHRGQAGVFDNFCAPITKVPDLRDVVRIGAGGIISSALTRDGTLWGWGAHTSWDGKGLFGMLGIGPVKRDWERPVPPIGMDGVVFWKQWDTTFAVKTDGTVWAWGRNDYGQVGNGAREHVHTPIQIKLPDTP